MSIEEETATIEQEPATAIEQEVVESEIDQEDEPIDLQALQEEEIEGDEQPEGEAEAEPEGEAEEAIADVIALEFDGEQYEVPKALESAFMMQKDYTQKTQEVAETRKTYEAKVEQAEQLLQATDEEMNAKAHLIQVQNELKQYEGVNWQQLSEEDPLTAQQHYIRYQELGKEQGQINEFIGQKSQERTAQAEQEIANRLQETANYAQKNIKGWSPDLDTKITEFASTIFPREQIQKAMNPDVYKMMHLAYLGSQTLQRQQQIKPKPTVKAKPLSKVNAKGNPTATGRVEDIDDMEAYAAARNKKLLNTSR